MMDILYLPKVGHYNLGWAKDLSRRHQGLEIFTHSTSWIDPENGKRVSFTSATDQKYFNEITRLKLIQILFMSKGLFLIHGYGTAYELILIIFAKLRGRKVLVRGEFTPRRQSTGYRLKHFAKIFTAKFVDGFFPISSEGAIYLQSDLKYKGKVKILPYIVDDTLIQEIFIPEKREYDFVFVGKLIQRKGISCLLKALKKYEGDQLIRVAIVGDGPLKSKLNDMMPSNVSIEYLGFLPPKECYSIIAKSKVLVLPSIFETWGLVVNEALMLGTNVVGSDTVGAMIELSDFSGKLFKFENNNEVDLLSKLMQAVAMEENVWLPETDLGKYDIKNHNDRIISFINEV